MPGPPLLVAADSNVLIDEELGEADVLDALATIRKRLPQAQFVLTETVFQELAWLSQNAESQEDRATASGALTKMLARRYTPLTMLPVERGIAAQIALKLRMSETIPHEEENDSLIVAESSLKGCSILLSSDEHLIEAHRDGCLWKILKECDTESPKLIIARPRDIVQQSTCRKDELTFVPKSCSPDHQSGEIPFQILSILVGKALDKWSQLCIPNFIVRFRARNCTIDAPGDVHCERLLTQLQASEHDAFVADLYRSRREYRSVYLRAGKECPISHELGSIRRTKRPVHHNCIAFRSLIGGGFAKTGDET